MKFLRVLLIFGVVAVVAEFLHWNPFIVFIASATVS